jgi:hypothetical protein
MVAMILIGCALVAVTVVVHAAGHSLVLQSLMKSRAAPPTETWPVRRTTAHPRGVVVDPDSCGRGHGLGVVLSMVGMPA